MIDVNAHLVRIVQTTDIALRLISARLLTILALVMTFALFGWAMAVQTPLGCIIASIWGLLIFNPVLWTGRKGLDHGERSGQGPLPPDADHAVPLENQP